MKVRLRTVIAAGFALLVVVTVLLASLLSGVFLRREFEAYVTAQQKSEADELAQAIASHYSPENGGWNIDYIHCMGMYALKDGYVLRLMDREGQTVWDAENHDMALCRKIMNTIRLRMQETHPELDGDFISARYEVKGEGEVVGYLEISYYTPYFMDENDFQFAKAANRILSVAGGVSLLLALGLGIVLAGRITKPLSGVVTVSKRISDGNYGVRIETERRVAELHELTDSVNRMAASLREQEVLRKQMTADIAHELRTPVANVSSYLELMLDGAMEPTPERIENCYQELGRLAALIADLERLEQEETGELVLRKEAVELRELAEHVIGAFATQIQEKDLKITVTGAPISVEADPGRLRQVLVNLISNAVKYTDSGGWIAVEVGEQNGCAVIDVADSGIGIPKEDTERVFERFYRTDKSRARKTGGTGIGLSIARAIVQAHGGTISCESEPGQGSRFKISLPSPGGKRLTP